MDDYIYTTLHHPYSSADVHYWPLTKAFPHGVALGTKGVPNPPRSVAARLLDLDANDFPSKYERRSELNRIRSRRQVDALDFGLLPHDSWSTALKPSSIPAYHVLRPSLSSTDIPAFNRPISPLSRYPLRPPIRMVAIAPLSYRRIPLPDSNVDHLTIDYEKEEARIQAGKEARRLQSAKWQSEATDRLLRQCKEKNRARNLQRRIDNARLMAPVFMAPDSNLGTRNKVLINYHTGGSGASEAPKETPAPKPSKAVVNGISAEDSSQEVTLGLQNRKKEEEKAPEESVNVTITVPSGRRPSRKSEEPVEEVEACAVIKIGASAPEPAPPAEPTSVSEDVTIELKKEPQPTEEAKPAEKKKKSKKEEKPAADKKPKKDEKKPAPEAKPAEVPVEKPTEKPVPAPEPAAPPTPEPAAPPTPEPAAPPTPEPAAIKETVSKPADLDTSKDVEREVRTPDEVTEMPVQETAPSSVIEEIPKPTLTPQTSVVEELVTPSLSQQSSIVEEIPTPKLSKQSSIVEETSTPNLSKQSSVVEEIPAHNLSKQSSVIEEVVPAETTREEISEESGEAVQETPQKETEEIIPDSTEAIPRQESSSSIRRLVSMVSRHEGDACDESEWDEGEVTAEIESTVSSSSRKIVLSASDDAIAERFDTSESQEVQHTTTTAEETSTTEEDTVVAAPAQEADTGRFSLDRFADDNADLSASTLEQNAEAGSTGVGDNAEETLSASGRPLSIDADSLVADDEQILDEAIESTYGTNETSEPRIEEPDEEYDESRLKSLTIEQSA